MRFALPMAALLVWLGMGPWPMVNARAEGRASAARSLEGPAGLAAPPPRGTPADVEGGARLAAPPAAAEPSEEALRLEASGTPWQGPRVELGYARYRLGDGYGGGVVHGAQFGGYLPTGRARLGLHGEMAGREYAPGMSTDLIVRATVVAGYQHVADGWPVLPYAAWVGTGGVLFGKRFATATSHTLWGAGMEIGADVPVVAPFWVGASFSWIRMTMDGLRYDLFILRLRVGL